MFICVHLWFHSCLWLRLEQAGNFIYFEAGQFCGPASLQIDRFDPRALVQNLPNTGYGYTGFADRAHELFAMVSLAAYQQAARAYQTEWIHL